LCRGVIGCFLVGGVVAERLAASHGIVRLQTVSRGPEKVSGPNGTAGLIIVL
jgi:hypothetical protein